MSKMECPVCIMDCLLDRLSLDDDRAISGPQWIYFAYKRLSNVDEPSEVKV